MNILITAIYLAAFSWHNVCGPDCNQNNNPAIGLDLSHSSGAYTLLTLPNTHSRQTVLLAKRWRYGMAGLVSGYGETPIPFLAPALSLGPTDLSCLSDLKTSVCILMFKLRF